MAAQPLYPIAIWSGLTLFAYFVGLIVNRRAGGQPLLHPIITASLILGVLLWQSNVSVVDYQHYTTLITQLLGPATVALAIPLYNQLKVVARLGWRMLIPMLSGGVIAPALAWLSVWLVMDNTQIEMTVLSKSITTPLAIEVTRALGGIPDLAAVIVITTGIIGAIAAPLIFRLLSIQNDQVKGIALGTVAHAIGTASAIRMSETTAALASTALCLNGVFTALLLPLLYG